MSKNANETTSKHHQETHQTAPLGADGRNGFFPASREAWAEVLATATRYY